MIWFTADLHFWHESVIKMQNRPFKDYRDMDDALIHHINECVGPNDRLFILGDVSHHITAEDTNALVKRLHGRKYLLLGNHDIMFVLPDRLHENRRSSEKLFPSVDSQLDRRTCIPFRNHYTRNILRNT